MYVHAKLYSIFHIHAYFGAAVEEKKRKYDEKSGGRHNVSTQQLQVINIKVVTVIALFSG